MFRFEKGTDYAVFLGDQVKFNFSYLEEKMGDTYFVNVPSLNINLYVKTAEEIRHSVQESLESYFNYWRKKSRLEFFDHMLNIGFSASRGKPSPITESPQKVRGRRRKKLSEEFTLSK